MEERQEQSERHTDERQARRRKDTEGRDTEESNRETGEAESDIEKRWTQTRREREKSRVR